VQGPHVGRKFRSVKRLRRPEIGLATLRRDGFVSVAAGEEEGLLLTRPLTIAGEELHVNADSRGYLIVQVTEGEGRPIAGYTSHPIAKNRTDARVRFDRPLGLLRNREVRLRFRLREADLYSYWFA